MPALRGALVSLDARSCQPAIAGQLRAQGGAYLRGLPANQPGRLAAVERPPAALPEVAACARWAYAAARPPRRYPVWTPADRRWGAEDGRWPDLATRGRGQATSATDDKALGSTQRYYLSRRPGLPPERADGFGRGHRASENALPGQLDVTFGGDEHRLREHQAAQNPPLVRPMARNLLKQDPTKRRSKNKRERLAWEEPFLERLLAARCTPAT